MCTVSMIGDGYQNQFVKRWPEWEKQILEEHKKPGDQVFGAFTIIELDKLATKEELAKVRDELEELKVLLKAAQKFDESTNQPHCDTPDKLKLIRWLAKELGVDLSDLNLNE
jgi:hypothetical protein